METIFLYHLLAPEGCHEDTFKMLSTTQDERYFMSIMRCCHWIFILTSPLYVSFFFIFNKHNHAVHPLSAYLANLLTRHSCAPSGVSSIFIDIHQISRSSDVACLLSLFSAALVEDELNYISHVISSCQKAYLTQRLILYSESTESCNPVTPEANSTVIYSCLLRGNYVSTIKFLRLYLGALPGMGKPPCDIYGFKDF